MQHIHLNSTEHRYNNHAAQRTEYRIHRTEQHRCNREQHTSATENRTQPQRTDTTQSCTHSFDFYHEYIDIKNSDTIELYTILQD